MRTGTPLTGRQVHGLVSDDYSLWTVQETLKALARLGLVESQTIGRAGIHTINEGHAAVPPLRALLDPVAMLRHALSAVSDQQVSTVILFGSVARGEATTDSDIDLAVIAAEGWDKRAEMEDHVRMRLGNACDVLVFTAAEFDRLSRTGKPVVRDILRDGVALVGEKPRAMSGAA
jgi:predicted nucleotidyltransferase